LKNKNGEKRRSSVGMADIESQLDNGDDGDVLYTYEGGFRNGLFHGKGVQRFSNGRVIKGYWVWGKLHGQCYIVNVYGQINLF
jgi:hypothetical protein